MKIILTLAALVSGFVAGQTVTTIVSVQKAVSHKYVAGDRVACAVNPTDFEADAKNILIDYTVPSNHTLMATLSLSGRQN